MTQNPESQAQAQALLTELAGSVALLPQDLPADAERPPEGGLALMVIEQDDTQFVPVFSTEEKLVAAGADPAQAVPVPIAQLAAGWPDEDLWLAVDPGDEAGLALPPDVVRALPGFAAETEA